VKKPKNFFFRREC